MLKACQQRLLQDSPTSTVPRRLQNNAHIWPVHLLRIGFWLQWTTTINHSHLRSAAGRKQALFTRYESIQYLHRYLQLSSSCQISASLLQNIYGIYTSMVSTHLWYLQLFCRISAGSLQNIYESLWYLYIYGVYNFAARYLQVHYKISPKSLWYLQIYGIYKFSTRYLWIATSSTTLYGNYDLYNIFQSLLMFIPEYSPYICNAHRTSPGLVQQTSSSIFSVFSMFSVLLRLSVIY